MAVRVRTVVLGLLALVVVLGAALITSIGWEVVLGPQARPLADRTFEVTEARLARGRYLAEGPAHCFHCHSEHDFTDPTFPTVPATKGAGWQLPIPELGAVYAPNITPDPETGLGSWTDDEVARAIQEGVSRDGTALFPVMPYPRYASLDEEDVASIVVYLRSLPAVRNVVPRSELIFPLNFIVNTIPEPLHEPRRSHPSGTPAERGAYLANMADCKGCHSPTDSEGTPLSGLTYGGGTVFHPPGPEPSHVFSQNITPDPSGIAHYDADLFVEIMRAGRLPGRLLSHVMPFEYYRTITDEDLRDLFAYLQTLPPVQHRVSNDDRPTPCAVCGATHGLGELNVRTGADAAR
jgi:mono/diheme cytochrome c family protein